MPNFNEVAPLESCQKSEKLSSEREKKKEETGHPQTISDKIKCPIISGVFRIFTRSKLQSIRYPLFYI